MFLYLSLSRIGEADNLDLCKPQRSCLANNSKQLASGPRIWPARARNGIDAASRSSWEMQTNVQREFWERVPSLHLIGQSEHPRRSQPYGFSPCLFLPSLTVNLHTLNNSVIISPLFKSVTNAMKICMFRLRCSFCDRRGKERDNPFCHHAKRGGRRHTGKKRKLEIAEGVVNILQCNVTTWSEHAKHYILTSDFVAALISETHLEREKLVTAVRRSALQAVAQVREYSHWSAHVGFPNPCQSAVTMLVFSAPTHDWKGGSYASWVGRFCCLLLISSTPLVSAAISTPIWCKTCVFSRETESFLSFWEQISTSRQTCGKTCPCTEAVFGFRNWEHQWSFQGEPHTCRGGKGQKPDIIDYFLVWTLIRPLIQKCEIVKSVPWGPHFGVKLTLNIKFDSVVSKQLIGMFSRRNQHNTNVLHGQSAQHTDSADPAIWNEARRNCVFEGKKPRSQDGQEDTQAACSQYAHACGYLEKADELGHALETWSDATNQYWVKVGRMCKNTLVWQVCHFSHEACVGRDIHATWMCHSGGWRQCRTKSLESLRPVG